MIYTFKQYLKEGKFEKGKGTVQDIINKVKGKTIIVFDTETTGLDPKRDFTMITELAAQAYNDQGKIIDTYHKKATLIPEVHDRMKEESEMQEKLKNPLEWNPNTVYHQKDVVKYGVFDSGKYEGKDILWISRTDNKGSEPNDKNPDWLKFNYSKKTIKDLLDMTEYYDENTSFEEIKEVLIGFKKWVDSFKNPVLVAHNARFDMYQVNAGLTKIDKKQKIKSEVLDTLTLSKNYLIPLLNKLDSEGLPEASKALKILKGGSKTPKNNLGVLGKLFDVKPTHWHSGISDVEQLAGILFKLIDYLKMYSK